MRMLIRDLVRVGWDGELVSSLKKARCLTARRKIIARSISRASTSTKNHTCFLPTPKAFIIHVKWLTPTLTLITPAHSGVIGQTRPAAEESLKSTKNSWIPAPARTRLEEKPIREFT